MSQFNNNQAVNLGVLAGHFGITTATDGTKTANSIIINNVYTKSVRCENTVNASALNALTATINSITSNIGTNLVIASPTGVIDFGNATISNFAGISANASRYEVIAPATVATTDATPTTLYPIPTVSNTAYTLNTDVIATDLTNSAASSINIKVLAKNIAGTVTVSAITTAVVATDASLAGIAVSYVVSGTDVNVRVTGLAVQNIKWFGATNATIQAF
jgi:hypothetical protein